MKFIFNLKEGERFPEAIALSGWRPLLLGSFAGWRQLLRNKKLLVTSALLIVTRSYQEQEATRNKCIAEATRSKKLVETRSY